MLDASYEFCSHSASICPTRTRISVADFATPSVCLDEIADTLAGQEATNLELAAETTAYLLFTSGSTGQPGSAYRTGQLRNMC
jgi:acyl-coenzyme A synthetase/AMP-(fatty) acid ligase